MKIATFNCNSIRTRIGIVIDWLAANEPDVLALQETKVVDQQFPLDPFTEAGWRVAFRGQKAYNGVAMVTRAEPEEVSFGLQDDEDPKGENSETRLCHLHLNGYHILNTYVPQGRDLESEKFQFKLDWFARLKRYLERCFKNPARAKMVWVGDLNVAPEPKDVHDHKRIWPHVCHCQEVVDAFSDVTSLGFEDVFRKHLPEEGVYTYWDYRTPNALKRGIGWRIDHVLATPSAERLSRSVTVDTEARLQEKPSDHTFVVAEFKD